MRSRSISKRGVEAATLAVAATLCGAAPAAAEPVFTFVSAPDTWNADVGSVSSASGWNPGEPDSINESWTAATGSVLDRLTSHSPRFALVAGDLVNGRWHEDADAFATFGKITSLESKHRAIREAARVYYSQWQASFEARGLATRPAVGDHELGDNPWRDAEKQALVPTYRRAWANAFTYRGGAYVYARHPPSGTQHARTAYAFRSGPVFFVTVDVFNQRADGTVHAEVRDAQLRWLDYVLRRANADEKVEFIVVQGQTPVLPPERIAASSGMRLEGGRSSPFWKTLRRHEVDLYLCGEFHAITASNDGGVEQLVHGGVLGWWYRINYLSVAVFERRLELTLHQALVKRLDDTRLWQTTAHRPWATRVVGDFGIVGTMTITADGRERYRTGYFSM